MLGGAELGGSPASPVLQGGGTLVVPSVTPLWILPTSECVLGGLREYNSGQESDQAMAGTVVARSDSGPNYAIVITTRLSEGEPIRKIGGSVGSMCVCL